MNLKLYKFKLTLKRISLNSWYWLMKPIAYFCTSEKMDKRYNKKQSKITEEQAIKWIAEDVARYAVRYNREPLELLICDYASDDDFWRGCTIDSTYLKRNKSRMAYYKFKKDIEFQEKVISYIKGLNGVTVEERIDKFNWERIRNYKKTYIISTK